MRPRHLLALALDPGLVLRAQGLTPDPWQRDLLLGDDRQVLLNCCRQAGKSTTVAALALHTVLFRPGALVLVLAPSQRQSLELFRKALDAYAALGRPLRARTLSPARGLCELENHSRLVALPGRHDTTRGFSAATLLVIDEAARVPDEVYVAVRPMLAVSGGRLVALSTPRGPRGFFWREWHGDGAWRRVLVTADDCPRLAPAFLQEEERALGPGFFDQEYRGVFLAQEGLVYPDFPQALVDAWPDPQGQPVGGIDWGFRNPFAAVWGVRDAGDVLWIGFEHYQSGRTPAEHVAAMTRLAAADPRCPPPDRVLWYADPSAPQDRRALRDVGWQVFPGPNDIRPGIAAVTARLRTGRLKVRGCPNLVAESRRYRYPSAAEQSVVGENPIDADNHALGALRYLVARLDARALARR